MGAHSDRLATVRSLFDI